MTAKKLVWVHFVKLAKCTLSVLQNKLQLLKARIHCFSTWVVMIKCFHLKPEKKNFAQIRALVF